MLVEFIPFWTIDLGATDHITRIKQPLYGILSNSKGKKIHIHGE
jgi:hypothetical protein